MRHATRACRSRCIMLGDSQTGAMLTMPQRPLPTRRDVLRFTAAGAATSAAAIALAPFVSAAESSSKNISMGFIGVGARGTVLLRAVLAYAHVDVPALCDIDEQNLTRALNIVEKA